MGNSLMSSSKAWRVAGVAVPGLRHVTKNKPCEDAIAVKVLPNQVFLAVLADGAGSAEEAETGARVASQAVLTHLAQELLDPDQSEEKVFAIFKAAVALAKSKVEAVANEAKRMPRAYASTLLMCAASADWTAAAQIGDGAALLETETREWRTLTKPCVDEYLNETVFLQAENVLEKLQTTFWKGKARHIALFSDGLQLLALKMPEGTAHAPFFAPLFKFLAGCEDSAEIEAQLKEFLRSPRVSARTDDDLSLILGLRLEA
jgi:hypothetical protein